MKTQQAKLFMNGRSQAVRLPKEFRLPGTAVYIHKSGDSVVLTPKIRPHGKDIWKRAFAACDRLTPDFFEIMKNRDQGVHERDKIFE